MSYKILILENSRDHIDILNTLFDILNIDEEIVNSCYFSTAFETVPIEVLRSVGVVFLDHGLDSYINGFHAYTQLMKINPDLQIWGISELASSQAYLPDESYLGKSRMKFIVDKIVEYSNGQNELHDRGELKQR